MNLNNQCGVITHDIDTILYANDSFCNIIDLPPNKIEGKSLCKFVSSNDWADLKKQFKKIKNTNSKLGYTIELVRENNDYMSVIAVSSLKNDKIETIFIPIQLGDEYIEDSLIDNVINSAPVGITIANIQLDDEPLIYVNDGFVNMTGYDRKEFIGQNCRFLQGENTVQDKVDKMRNAIQNRETTTVELRNYTKDGEEFWNRVTLMPVKHNSNDVTHYLGFQENITEEKQHEKDKNVFKKHVEKSDNAMFVTNEDWVIQYVNPSFEEITGYSCSEITGEKANILKSNNEKSLIYDDILNKLENKETWKGELINIKKSGERYTSKQTITPIVDDKNNITNITVIQEDITNKQINEQILNVLNRVLRHNLRSSLNVIEGYAKNLEEDAGYNNQRMAVRAICNRTEQMTDICKKMAHVRNLVNGRDEPNNIKLREVLDIVHSYNEQDIELNMNEKYYDYKIKYGDLFIMAFKESLSRSLNKESSKITINVEESKEDKDIINFYIVNSEDDYNKEKWDIIKSGKETPLKHTDGLDLWILYWSITAIGGTVEYEKVDKGTKFILCIPIIS